MFDIGSSTLCAVGKIRSLPASVVLAERLADIQDKVRRVLDECALGTGDVLVCEAQTTVRDPHAAFKVEHVRGIFESVARDRAVTVPGRINPRSIQSEVMGLRGRQLARKVIKDAAQRTALALYGAAFESMGLIGDEGSLARHQDIIDATLVGNLALTRLRHAAHTDIALTQLFAPRVRERIGRRMFR